MEIRNQCDYERGFFAYNARKRRTVVFLPPFIVTRHDGQTQVFYDLSEIPSHIKVSRHRTWTHSHYVSETKQYYSVTYLSAFICRDDRGQIVLQEDINDARPKKDWRKVHYAHIWHAAELGLPIPRTGVRRWHRGHHPAFIRFKRRKPAAEYDQTECDHRIKGKIQVPPVDPWDDYPRSSGYDRSWKKFRKTQWKDKP